MSASTTPVPGAGPADALLGHAVDRRRFLTYLVAGPTVAIAVTSGMGPAQAAIPGSPEPADFMDLGDILILAAKPTEGLLIQLVAGEDGTVSCALPREEVGQGILTATAMIIADELAMPIEKVQVTLADARPELLTGQLTGGSNTIRAVYKPLLAACAAMRGSFLAAAAQRLGLPASDLVLSGGAVSAPGGSALGYGELAAAAAQPSLDRSAGAASPAAGKIVGTPTNRLDARAIVTGQQKYTLDLDVVPGAKPAVVRRPDTLRGSVQTIRNLDAVRAMPGVLAVEVIEIGRNAFKGTDSVEQGIAVVAETFGEAINAKEALDVTWNRGPVTTTDDAAVKAALRAAQLPLTVPSLSALGIPSLPLGLGLKTLDGEFDFAFASHAPLETNTAVADVRGDSAEVWAGLKTPVVAQQTIAAVLGLPQSAVTVHCVQGGGSFGRRLFFDSALEAARISQAVGMPVKLLWPRVDDMRHGRARAASNHRLRFAYVGKDVVSFEQRVASVETDFRHGLGEILTAVGSQINPPTAIPFSAGGNASFAQTVFLTTIKSPYQFGLTTQLLNESSQPFNTGSWRSVYSANTRGAEEIMVTRLARAMGKDPAAFRLEFLSNARQRAVLQKVITEGEWGKRMPRGFAQGIAFHEEYKSVTAIVVEMDARDPQDPRVTRATIAADYGLPINPRGLEAQLQGGLTDAIATTLRAGLHLQDGLFLEGSYSQFHFPRQADTPTDVRTFIFPATEGAEPGGAGELGVPAAVGAIASAYEAATGRAVSSFPIVFPVDFTPLPKGAGSTNVRVPLPK